MAENTMVISQEQLQKLLEGILANQSESTKEIVATAIKAAKELPDAEKDKITEAERRRQISMKQSRDQIEAEEKAKKQCQDNCGHKKENGKWATSGQVIGGRYSMLICQRCQKPWYKEFDREVTSQLLSGDLVLFQADPEGWSTQIPWATA